jgi:hypothetical protein
MSSRGKGRGRNAASPSRSPSNSPKARKSDTSDVTNLLKILPQLAEVGYDEWMRSLQLIAYSEDWYDTTAPDAPDEWEPSNFDVSLQDKKSVRDRKICFTIMYKCCKGLEHLFEGVKLGDPVHAYKNLKRVYNRDTTAGFITAQAAFTSSRMELDHADLPQFVALVSRRAKRVIALGGAVTEKQKVSVLLKGLLSEFKVIKTLIEVRPMNVNTYEVVCNDLTDYAITEEIYNLKNGGNRGAKTFSVAAGGSDH